MRHKLVRVSAVIGAGGALAGWPGVDRAGRHGGDAARAVLAPGAVGARRRGHRGGGRDRQDERLGLPAQRHRLRARWRYRVEEGRAAWPGRLRERGRGVLAVQRVGGLPASDGASQVDHWNGKKWTVAKSFPGLGHRAVGARAERRVGLRRCRRHEGRVPLQRPQLDDGDLDPAGRLGHQRHRTCGPSAAPRSRTTTATSGRRRTWPSCSRRAPAARSPVLSGILALAPNNVYATGVGWAGWAAAPRWCCTSTATAGAG